MSGIPKASPKSHVCPSLLRLPKRGVIHDVVLFGHFGSGFRSLGDATDSEDEDDARRSPFYSSIVFEHSSSPLFGRSAAFLRATSNAGF